MLSLYGSALIALLSLNYLQCPAQPFDDTPSSMAEVVPPLKPSQIEFTKRWWKQLGYEQKMVVQTQQSGRRRVANYQTPVRPPGDFQFMDSIADTFFPIGDAYSGVPDGYDRCPKTASDETSVFRITDLARYCVWDGHCWVWLRSGNFMFARLQGLHNQGHSVSGLHHCPLAP